jgi:hypothetical protein
MCQSASREDPINLFDTEGKTARLLRALSLDRRDAVAQVSQDLIADSRHRSRNPFGSRRL